MFAVLNINKPVGLTSRDVVDRVQRLVGPHKAGHAGTLDPLATGVLLVCVGQATRLVQFAQRLPKAYRGTFLLGRRSETDDVERGVEIVEGARAPTFAEIEAALPQFTGEIAQRPPRHSAIKIAGKRAYQLARRGVDFEPAPKIVAIHRLEIIRYDYPELELDVDCGSGTYIRSLGRDLAEALGTNAVMAALDRTAIGEFTTATAATLEQLAGDWQSHLQSPALLVAEMPSITVTPDELREFQYGRSIAADTARFTKPTQLTDEIAALDASGNVVALVNQRRPGQLTPTRNFTQPE